MKLTNKKNTDCGDQRYEVDISKYKIQRRMGFHFRVPLMITKAYKQS